jgi:hypothetical protein
MKCAKCGLTRGLDDRVCRRCKYVFDEDRFIAVTPPRAADGSVSQRLLDQRFGFRLPVWTGNPWVLVLASLIPGLGHILSGRVGRGLIFMAVIVALISLSIQSFSGLGGQMLFGLCVSAHAFCILDLTPWAQSPLPGRRATAMVAILAALLLVYWPLLTFLANVFVPATRVNRDGLFSFPTNAIDPGRLVALGFLFVISLWISARAGRWWASRRSGGGGG